MEKKLEVIIPAYKAQETIARTLFSIAGQSIANQLRITIVNDADTVGYQRFIDSFSPFLEIRELTLENNGGPGVARQTGLDLSQYPYITFIDADDSFASPFALEIMVNKLDENLEYHTVIGTFIEERPNLQFLSHQNDLVWMFGKMYRRDFLSRYKIRFNETRANEDNGFNTIIRLVSSETEKIMFLPDITYIWRYKEDSITRVNNFQYSYDQSFVGYTDNMIYAIKHAKKHKPFNSYIDLWAIQVMGQLYIYYYQTVKRDARFVDQNYESCKKYYKEVFEHYHKTMTKEILNDVFAQTLAQQSSNMLDFVAEKTIHQFIEQLDVDSNGTMD